MATSEMLPAVDVGEQVTVDYTLTTREPRGLSYSVTGVVEYAKGDTYVVASASDPTTRVVVHGGAAYSLVGLAFLGDYATLEVRG